MVNCALCKPLEHYEICSFQYWRVVANYNQNKLGKCMVCLKRHDEDICNLSEDEIKELWDIIRKLKAALAACFRLEHFNYAFLMNKDAHVHLHVIPRYQSRRVFAGMEFQDSDEIESLELPEHVLRQIIEAIQTTMQASPG